MIKIISLLFLLSGISLVYSQDLEYPVDPEDPQDSDEDILDQEWDYDSIFNRPFIETEEPESESLVLRNRIELEASYGLRLGISPGWSETPWHNADDEEYSLVLGARMDALLSMNLALTDDLRVKNSFYFSVPDNPEIDIQEFYFEYNMLNKAFFQVGIYEIAWGISRFYPFANLPARIPENRSGGTGYIARVNIPIGIGGVEVLGLTRRGFIEGDTVSDITAKELSYGLKYNLALQQADIDAGVLYHWEMPLRFIVSIKTTIGNTELYTEGLAAVSHRSWNGVRYAANLGFLRDFFRNRITLTGELFYNDEPQSEWWRPVSDILDAEEDILLKGFNSALAIIYRINFLHMRIFTQSYYNVEQNSAWLVPGISIRPGDTFTLSISVPMALGDRSGHYYSDNMDPQDRPFSILFGLSYSGRQRSSF